ncbi:aladin-like [Physella acuta]|uniref:aladin-like n=1 Tax=Physella acuta TaxID=109671 RepID=UPI0027DC1B7E|nr:aladin-like [Physella acuta]XP_059148730.1 aladin-like [Physella acuta]
MASILLQFPPPPRRQPSSALPRSTNCTVFEQEGQLKDIPDSTAISSVVAEYPKISLQNEAASRVNVRYENAQLAFLSNGQSSWKKPLHAWYNGGFLNMFDQLSELQDEAPQWMLSACKMSMSIVQILKSFKNFILPKTVMSNEEILSNFTHVSDWHKSPIQALAWHPHVIKVAIALHDDSVHIYYSGSDMRPLLKHKLQKQVTDLAWQPLSSSILAVACQACVLIWHIEPTSLAVRPSSSTVQVLQYNNHSPVTSLAWSPDGDHLISASPRQTSIVVWDVPKETGIALSGNRGGGITLLSYAPDSSKLFTATPSPHFRVWDTKGWLSENWYNLSGHCTAACWSPDGKVLVFAMEKNSALYAVRFPDCKDENSLSAVNTSMLLADVSQVSISTANGEEIRVGGQVKSVVWDKTGERLAVLFQPNELENNQVVAVFKSTIYPVLELFPGGFIKGESGESAHHIAFLPCFNKGALLSIVWSSGNVSYVPMYFVPACKIPYNPKANFGPWLSTSFMSPK